MFKVLFLIGFSNLTMGSIVGLNVLEPSIECTVIKVNSSIPLLGFDNFPKLYDSINNNPLKSKLLIAGREFPKLNPETILKTETYERISIIHDRGTLELVLNGKPISRNGVLKENGFMVLIIEKLK
jgi:hypothetical protein